jgi:hypothetical protein
MKKYFYEVYIKGPDGEPGHEIKVGTIDAVNLFSAKTLVENKFASLDCFIDIYQVLKDFVIYTGHPTSY